MSIITDRDEIMNIRGRIYSVAVAEKKNYENGKNYEKRTYNDIEYLVLKKVVYNNYIYYILLNGIQVYYSYATFRPGDFIDHLQRTPLLLLFYSSSDDSKIYIDLLNTLYTETVDDTKKYAKIGSPQSGGKRTAPAAPAYKLNGEKVHLLINKKKLHRSVYVKGNGKAKYCKINYEFVLLSKLKNKII